MAGQGVSGMAVAAAGAGALLAWSGIRGTSVTGALRELLAGRQPSGPVTLPVAGTPPSAFAPTGPFGATAGSGASGSAIASDALRYQGHPYLYGGSPGPSGTSPWDCSSFCNWVLGHDLGMALPGASAPGYSGTSHGPTTLSYLTWGKAVTIGSNPGAAQPGDLCVWQTHMGIATGNGQMISALNPSLGTAVTSISGGGPSGELLLVRRVSTAGMVPPGKLAAVSGG